METPHITCKRITSKEGNPTDQSHNNGTKFEIVQQVMVKNHACHNFESRFLLD